MEWKNTREIIVSNFGGLPKQRTLDCHTTLTICFGGHLWQITLIDSNTYIHKITISKNGREFLNNCYTLLLMFVDEVHGKNAPRG